MTHQKTKLVASSEVTLAVGSAAKEHDRLEALEFASDADVFLDGIRLFDLRANQAIQFLRQRDAHLRLEQDGATSKELCLGLWIPDAFEPEAAVESVILFRDDYYST